MSFFSSQLLSKSTRPSTVWIFAPLIHMISWWHVPEKWVSLLKKLTLYHPKWIQIEYFCITKSLLRIFYFSFKFSVQQLIKWKKRLQDLKKMYIAEDSDLMVNSFQLDLKMAVSRYMNNRHSCPSHCLYQCIFCSFVKESNYSKETSIDFRKIYLQHIPQETIFWERCSPCFHVY